MKLSTTLASFAFALIVAAVPNPAPVQNGVTGQAAEAAVVIEKNFTPQKDAFFIQYYCGRGYYCSHSPYLLCCNAVFPPTCCPTWTRYCSLDGKWCF